MPRIAPPAIVDIEDGIAPYGAHVRLPDRAPRSYAAPARLAEIPAADVFALAYA